MRYVGFVHSIGKRLSDIGNAAQLRFKPEQYNNGNWFLEWIGNSAKRRKLIYIDKRSYGKQINDILHENVKELFINIAADSKKSKNIYEMTVSVINTIYGSGFKGILRVGGMNEFTEIMNVKEYIAYMKVVRQGVNDTIHARKIRVSAGQFSTHQRKSWLILFDKLYNIVDSFDFHLDSDANSDGLGQCLLDSPKNKDFILSEFYFWNIGFKYGYDSKQALDMWKRYRTIFTNIPRLTHVYFLFPYIGHKSGSYVKLGLNIVDDSLRVIHSTQLYREIVKWVKTLKLK